MDKNRVQSQRNAAQRAQAMKNRKIISNLESSPDAYSYSDQWLKNKFTSQANHGGTKFETGDAYASFSRRSNRSRTSPERPLSAFSQYSPPKPQEKRESSREESTDSADKQVVTSMIARYATRTTNSSPIRDLSKGLKFIQKRNQQESTGVPLVPQKKSSPESGQKKPNVNISLAEFKPPMVSITSRKFQKDQAFQHDAESDLIGLKEPLSAGVKSNTKLPDRSKTSDGLEMKQSATYDYRQEDFDVAGYKYSQIKKDSAMQKGIAGRMRYRAMSNSFKVSQAKLSSETSTPQSQAVDKQKEAPVIKLQTSKEPPTSQVQSTSLGKFVQNKDKEVQNSKKPIFFDQFTQWKKNKEIKKAEEEKQAKALHNENPIVDDNTNKFLQVIEKDWEAYENLGIIGENITTRTRSLSGEASIDASIVRQSYLRAKQDSIASQRSPRSSEGSIDIDISSQQISPPRTDFQFDSPSATNIEKQHEVGKTHGRIQIKEQVQDEDKTNQAINKSEIQTMREKAIEKELQSASVTNLDVQHEVIRNQRRLTIVDEQKNDDQPKLAMRKSEIQRMREKAIAKERNRLMRHNAAFKIQSAWRKYQISSIITHKQTSHDSRNREQTLQAIGQSLKQSFAPWKILNALRKWAAKKQAEREVERYIKQAEKEAERLQKRAEEAQRLKKEAEREQKRAQEELERQKKEAERQKKESERQKKEAEHQKKEAELQKKRTESERAKKQEVERQRKLAQKEADLQKKLAEKEAERQGMYLQFQTYAAQFIQKNWRGYNVRKQFSHRYAKECQAKIKIASLWPLWKTKKILLTKPILDLKQQLSDMEDMIFELIRERNSDLARKMTKTIPQIKGELIRTFHYLYESSTWLEYMTTSKRKPRKSIEEQPKQSQDSPQVKPKEYLRRTSARSPDPFKIAPVPVKNPVVQKPKVPSVPAHRRSISMEDRIPETDSIQTPEQDSLPQTNTTDTRGSATRNIPNSANRSTMRSNSRRSRRASLPEVPNHSPSQEAKEDSVPVSKAKFPFLRRSSVAVTAQEINFKKVESRTDCWLKRENTTQGRINSLSNSPDAIRGYGNASRIEENKQRDLPARPASSFELNHPSVRLKYSASPSPDYSRPNSGRISPVESCSPRAAFKSYDFTGKPKSSRKAVDFQIPSESPPAPRMKGRPPKELRPQS